MRKCGKIVLRKLNELIKLQYINNNRMPALILMIIESKDYLNSPSQQVTFSIFHIIIKF